MSKFLRVACLGVLLLGFGNHAIAAADAKAAEALARQSGCLKCHAPEKKKEGPPLKEIAAKWRDKPDAMVKLTKHVTTLTKVKIDGVEEEHGAVKSKDPAEIRNLLEWVLNR